MHALKGLVIGMGVLILVGMVAMIVLAAQRLTGGDRPVPAQQGFGALTLDLPDGARVTDRRLDGATLVLELADDAGTRTWIVVDIVSGREIGRIQGR